MRQRVVHSGQGSNSTLVGDFNERVVLTTLRRLGPASKADLARIVGLTSNAAGVIVRKLELNGLVRVVGKRHGARGQPATILELDPDGAFSIGMRIDRDMIEAVLVDLQGRILERSVLDHLPEPLEAIRHMAESVARFRAVLGPARTARLAGIGVAAPYDLGSWLIELGLPEEKFRLWDAFDVEEALARATGLTVVVENDGNAAAAGELIYGRGRGLDNFLYLFIGPAIGGGVVLAGDYLRGNAGDVAVMPVGASSLASAPLALRQGTILMARASLNALMRHLRFRGGVASGTAGLPGAILADPAGFREWQADACIALAGPILTSAHLLDLGHVVLDSDLPGDLLQPFVASLQECCAGQVAQSRHAPAILQGSIGKDAGAVGAASLPLHMSFSPQPGVLTGEMPIVAAAQGGERHVGH